MVPHCYHLSQSGPSEWVLLNGMVQVGSESHHVCASRSRNGCKMGAYHPHLNLELNNPYFIVAFSSRPAPDERVQLGWLGSVQTVRARVHFRGLNETVGPWVTPGNQVSPLSLSRDFFCPFPFLPSVRILDCFVPFSLPTCHVLHRPSRSELPLLRLF